MGARVLSEREFACRQGAASAADGGAAGLGGSSPGYAVAASAVALSAALPMFLTGALSVQMRVGLGFDDAQLGIAIGLFFLAAGVTSVTVGAVAQHTGIRTGVRVSALTCGAALLAIALVAQTRLHLMAALAVGGIANSMAQLSANTALAISVQPRRLGLLFGVRQSAVPGAALMTGGAVPFVGLTAGWRWAFGLALVMPAVAVSAGSRLPRASAGRAAYGRDAAGHTSGGP